MIHFRYKSDTTEPIRFRCEADKTETIRFKDGGFRYETMQVRAYYLRRFAVDDTDE